MNASLTDERDALRRRLMRDERHHTIVRAAGLDRTAFDALGLDRRRTIISAVVEQVTIGPGVQGLTRFDPDRAAIDWRA